jgi:hypothetical protein
VGRARHLRLLALALAAPLALGACGTSDDRAQARAAVARFYADVGRHDGDGACGELSQDAIKDLIEQEQASCRRAVTTLKVKPGRITRVQVFVTNAKVDLSSGDTAFLDRAAGGWKLSAVGCRPEEKPADHPYDCEVQA